MKRYIKSSSERVEWGKYYTLMTPDDAEALGWNPSDIDRPDELDNYPELEFISWCIGNEETEEALAEYGLSPVVMVRETGRPPFPVILQGDRVYDVDINEVKKAIKEK